MNLACWYGRNCRQTLSLRIAVSAENFCSSKNICYSVSLLAIRVGHTSRAHFRHAHLIAKLVKNKPEKNIYFKNVPKFTVSITYNLLDKTDITEI